MNKHHPPKYPHRDNGDYTIADVVAGIITLAVMFGAAWIWLVIAGGN